jgi:hypothetical protein
MRSWICPRWAQSARLKAAVPLGDTESLWRLRERTDDMVTRPAGSTALVDANIPPDDEPESGQEPDGDTPIPYSLSAVLRGARYDLARSVWGNVR